MSGKKSVAKRKKRFSRAFGKAHAMQTSAEVMHASEMPSALRLSAKTDVRCYRRETSEDLSDELMRLLRRAAE